MTRPPILPGMLSDWGNRFVECYNGEVRHHDCGDWCRADVGEKPDYSDPATCGALMAWCHREFSALDARRIPHTRWSVARRAINEARPWDAASVERAVNATLEVLP